jgi:hypothetical protein
MIPPLSIGKGLLKKDPKEQSVAEAIAAQSGLIKDDTGHNPVTDYIMKKQTEANASPKAKHTHAHYTPKGRK